MSKRPVPSRGHRPPPNDSAAQERAARGFVPADAESEHPLARLHGRRLDGARIQVMLGPTSRFGARYFRLFFEDETGSTSLQPAVIGLHHAGPYPAYNWIEVAELNEHPSFPGGRDRPGATLDLGGGSVQQRLFGLLAEIIPPGGHIMVEYDSPQQAATARSLARGVPPVATPLGALLFAAGCGTSFKDWDIAEGGREGPRKLQGFKALNEDDARAKAARMARELVAYLDSPRADAELERAAFYRALQVLKMLRIDDPALAHHVRDALKRRGVYPHPARAH